MVPLGRESVNTGKTRAHNHAVTLALLAGIW
jgi:hypothetical protein